MTWWVQEEHDEGFVLSRTRPKYSVLLEEEDYESEGDEVPGFDKGPEENYGVGVADSSPGVADSSPGAADSSPGPWDPWEPSYFFLLK
jgi:hypothetical protein